VENKIDKARMEKVEREREKEGKEAERKKEFRKLIVKEEIEIARVIEEKKRRKRFDKA